MQIYCYKGIWRKLLLFVKWWTRIPSFARIRLLFFS